MAGRTPSSPIADLSVDDVRPAGSIVLPAIRWCAGVPHATALARQSALYRFAARSRPLRGWRHPPATSRGSRTTGFSFDLQVFAPQMARAADLAESCPDVTFHPAARRHAGGPVARGARADWRAGMQRLAACPNVVSKLSGLGTFIHRNDPDHIAGIVADNRCGLRRRAAVCFGSNFPIEKLWIGYPRTLMDTFRAGDLTARHGSARGDPWDNGTPRPTGWRLERCNPRKRENPLRTAGR